ncbi:MAG: rod shape-determining protein RodA [Bacteroidales bacterium]|nr:rod shape-determining protein RodA [Bacteroidales bacterium]
MRQRKGIFDNIDWVIIALYFTLVLIGWLNIYAAVYNESHRSIFDITQNYGRQLIWITTSLIIIFTILMIDAKFYNAFSIPLYIISVFLLVVVLFLGKEVAGARSWFQLGSFAFQPSELAKVTTALALARYVSSSSFNIKKKKAKIYIALLIGAPMILIYLQNDTGSALVYFSFLLVLFREGLSGKIMITGVIIIMLSVIALLVNKFIITGFLALIIIFTIMIIRRRKAIVIKLIGLFIVATGFVFSVEYAFENILEPHQQTRVNVLLGKEVDLRGAGYNVNQSKIAIGSGGFTGKGFLNGTQTKYDFVPEQSTDFIFCTVGEEWGFLGSLVVIALYIGLLLRIIMIAERQRSIFSRIYGYGVASIFFFHFAINIGMTIGLAPVIGIPLPFLSYGGSSLWAFTILLFILIRLDESRQELV